ncbi:hypothetical protein ABT255_03030 [Streptomyces mirabilis]|uniref:hypothetical protein n=1 Tax=Streptomyces mirabilis TaxID=68239 RepID=UPI00332A2223
MTDHRTLLQLLGEWVTVTHPSAPHRVWHGQLASLMDCPSVVLQMPEGGTEVLPQSLTIVGARPAPGGPHPDVEADARSFVQLRDSGLLWLINRVAFHPCGLALALHIDEEGQAYGWSPLTNDEGEPWQFDPATDNDGVVRAEATIAEALQDCPDSIASVRCCVCSGGPVTHENFQGNQLCALCTECDCGRDVYLRTGLHRPPEGKCTATWQHPHRGLIRCEQDAGHYTSDYCAHQGRTPDGAPMQWRDADTGATPHCPGTSGQRVRTVQDDRPDTGGLISAPALGASSTHAVTSADTVRTHPHSDASGRVRARVGHGQALRGTASSRPLPYVGVVTR